MYYVQGKYVAAELALGHLINLDEDIRQCHRPEKRPVGIFTKNARGLYGLIAVIGTGSVDKSSYNA